MKTQKYPRTLHLPWSAGITRGDKVMQAHDLHDLLQENRLIITEKLDGSNVCLTSQGVYARSHNGPPSHPSFATLKAIYSRIRHLIPDNIAIFGEWCWAVHSIKYGALDMPPLYLFAVRHEVNGLTLWQSWESVVLTAKNLGVFPVPALAEVDARALGQAGVQQITDRLMAAHSVFGGAREGLVVRSAHSFLDDEWPYSIGKLVRADHVQADDHWASGQFHRQPLVIPGKRLIQ